MKTRSNILSFRFIFLLVSVSCFMAFQDIFANDSTSSTPKLSSEQISQFIDMVQASEKRYRSFRWTVKKNLTPESAYSLKNCWFETEVLYDIASSRFCYKHRGVTPWLQNDKPAQASANEYQASFDGHIYMTWERSNPGYDLPIKDNGSAIISPNKSDCDKFEHFKKYCLFSIPGIPSFFFDIYDISDEPNFLSAFLLKWKNNNEIIDILESERDELVFLIEKKSAKELSPYIFIAITYDLKYGIIKKMDWGPHFELVVDRIEIEYNFNNDKPTPIKITQSKPYHIEQAKRRNRPQPADSIHSYQPFHDFEVNPSFSDKDFKITIHKGTYVDDHIEMMYYRMGETLNKAYATEKYIQLHNLIEPDETTEKTREKYSD